MVDEKFRHSEEEITRLKKKIQEVELEIKHINMSKIMEDERKSWEEMKCNSRAFYKFAKSKSRVRTRGRSERHQQQGHRERAIHCASSKSSIPE